MENRKLMKKVTLKPKPEQLPPAADAWVTSQSESDSAVPLPPAPVATPAPRRSTGSDRNQARGPNPTGERSLDAGRQTQPQASLSQEKGRPMSTIEHFDGPNDTP